MNINKYKQYLRTVRVYDYEINESDKFSEMFNNIVSYDKENRSADFIRENVLSGLAIEQALINMGFVENTQKFDRNNPLSYCWDVLNTVEENGIEENERFEVKRWRNSSFSYKFDKNKRGIDMCTFVRNKHLLSGLILGDFERFDGGFDVTIKGILKSDKFDDYNYPSQFQDYYLRHKLAVKNGDMIINENV